MSAGRLRAPSGDRQILVAPPLDSFPGVIASNGRAFQESGLRVAGASLEEFRAQAQSEALSAAADYSRQCGESLPPPGRQGILVSGHQPELFHPGVWVKNFALSALSARHDLTPLNLVIDSDNLKSAAVRLPSWRRFDPDEVRLRQVPFDRFEGERPFEDRPVLEAAVWESAPARLLDLARDWGFAPMLPALWGVMEEVRRGTPLLGELFAAGRRFFERQWGVHNLEVPLSRVNVTRAFALFTRELLLDLPTFQAAYNSAVGGYRRLHGLRSRSHPVPDLADDAGWVEAPLWGWRRSPSPLRQRVWVRRTGAGLVLKLGAGERLELRAEPADAFADDWVSLAHQGVRLRSRALLTTLYARLALGEGFIHGLGGGKYDEVTDEILREYFGLRPPGYLIMTGTLHLPLRRFDSGRGEVAALSRLIRDMTWNPQRYLLETADPEVRREIDEREGWVKSRPLDRSGRRERFYKVREVTSLLRGKLDGPIGQAAEGLRVAERQANANRLLCRRDYSFALYPAEMLRRFLSDTLD